MFRACCFAAAILCSATSSARSQSTWFVDDDAASGGDGASWSSAFRFLQDALVVAQPGDEVRVAGGRYSPDAGGGQTAGDRDAKFLLDGLTIAGGYRGLAGGGAPDDRDFALFPTLVTGDLAHDDPSRSDNSRQLFVLAGDGGLDGLVVASAESDTGGAVVDVQGHAFTARDCEFRDHGHLVVGTTFGAITAQRCWFHDDRDYVLATAYGPIALTDVTFEDNVPTAVGVWHASLTAERCAFRRGISDDLGGAIVAYGGDVTLTECVVEDNSSPGSGWEGGGAITSFDGGALRLHRTRFSRNSCQDSGGAVYVFSPDDAIDIEVVECLFEDNHADRGSGALHLDSDDPALLVDSRFVGNSATTGGGAGGGLISSVVRCAFVGNTSPNGLGGLGIWTNGNDLVIADSSFEGNEGLLVPALSIASAPGDEVFLERCTVADNHAAATGGAAVLVTSTDAQSFRVADCILFGNDRNGIEDEAAQLSAPAGAIAIDRSCVEGWTGALGGSGNFGSDPLFVDPASGRFDLQLGSPCVEAGDPGYAPAAGFERDVAGNCRVLDAQLDRTPQLDRGAYEFTHARLTLSGDPQPGGTLTIALDGSAGLPALMFLGFGEATRPLRPLGVVFIDLGAPFLLLPWPSAPSQVSGDLPADVAPLTFFLQAAVFQAPSGNLSNLVRVDVR